MLKGKWKYALCGALAVCALSAAALGFAVSPLSSRAADLPLTYWQKGGGNGTTHGFVGGIASNSLTYECSTQNILTMPDSTAYVNFWYDGIPNSWHSLTLKNGNPGSLDGYVWTMGGADKTTYPWHSLLFKSNEDGMGGGQIFDERGFSDGHVNAESVLMGLPESFTKAPFAFEIHIGTGSGGDESYIKDAATGVELTCQHGSVLKGITKSNFPSGCYLTIGVIYADADDSPAAISDLGGIYADGYTIEPSAVLQYQAISEPVGMTLHARDENGFTDKTVEVAVNAKKLSSGDYTVTPDGQQATVSVTASALNALSNSELDTLNYLSCRVLNADGTLYGSAFMPFEMVFEKAPVLKTGSQMFLEDKNGFDIKFTYDGSADVLGTGADSIAVVSSVSAQLIGAEPMTRGTDYTVTKATVGGETEYTVSIAPSYMEKVYASSYSRAYRITLGMPAHRIDVLTYLEGGVSPYGVRFRAGIDYVDGTLVQDEYYSSATLKTYDSQTGSSRIFYENGVSVKEPITLEYSHLDPALMWMCLSVMNTPVISESFTETTPQSLGSMLVATFFGENRSDMQAQIGWADKGNYMFMQSTKMKNNVITFYIGETASEGYMIVNGERLGATMTIKQSDFPEGKAYIGLFFANSTPKDHEMSVNSHLNAVAIESPQADDEYAMDLGNAKDFSLELINTDGDLSLKDETGAAIPAEQFTYKDRLLTIKAEYFAHKRFTKEGRIFIYDNTRKTGTAFRMAYSNSGREPATIAYVTLGTTEDVSFELPISSVDYVLSGDAVLDPENYSFADGKFLLKAAAVRKDAGWQELIVCSEAKLYPCYLFVDEWQNGIRTEGSVLSGDDGYTLTGIGSVTEAKTYDLTDGYTFRFEYKTIETYFGRGVYNQQATSITVKLYDPFTGITFYVTVFANYADEALSSSTTALYITYGATSSVGAEITKTNRPINASTVNGVHGLKLKGDGKGGLEVTVAGWSYSVSAKALGEFNLDGCILTVETSMSTSGSVVSVSVEEGMQTVGDERHIHSFEEGWTSDETAHWHKATCEHGDQQGDYEEHIFKDGVCTVCGYRAGSDGGCGSVIGAAVLLPVLAAAGFVLSRKKRN